ncbi:beta-1,3-galactosyltransferase 5-like [Lineus longissimus]|uniref:beta-1,3-galactosyltransferase 5-like n=1 Tax=Lineus longissimus TaxID=88925 RepID=UPI00315D4132
MDTYAEWTVKPVSPCPESTSAFLLILVGSPVTNHYRRHLVRSTWGNITSHKGYSIKVIFYMGKALNYNKQRELLSESKTHNDIVQSEIDDGYYNLTLKNLNGFKWAMKECPVARFVLKVDDDVFVYPKNTVDHLDTLKVSHEVKLYQGYRMSANPAYRNKGNKWYISHEAYKNATYPPYNLGFAVLFSMKVVKEIHDASFKAPGYFQVKRNFPFEDVFIGMCAKYLGIVPEAVYDRFFRNPPSFSDAVSANQCKYLTAIAAHALNPDWFCYYSKASEIVRESNLCAKQT